MRTMTLYTNANIAHYHISENWAVLVNPFILTALHPSCYRNHGALYLFAISLFFLFLVSFVRVDLVDKYYITRNCIRYNTRAFIIIIFFYFLLDSIYVLWVDISKITNWIWTYRVTKKLGHQVLCLSNYYYSIIYKKETLELVTFIKAKIIFNIFKWNKL